MLCVIQTACTNSITLVIRPLQCHIRPNKQGWIKKKQGPRAKLPTFILFIIVIAHSPKPWTKLIKTASYKKLTESFQLISIDMLIQGYEKP